MTNIYQKIANVQKAVGKMVKDQKVNFKQVKYSYFDINQLLEALKPHLEAEDLLVMQSVSSVDGRPALRTRIIDLEGDGVWDDVGIIPDLPDPQKCGSSITYFRRYSLVSIFLMEAADDDGQSAVPVKKQSASKYFDDLKKAGPPEDKIIHQGDGNDEMNDDLDF